MEKKLTGTIVNRNDMYLYFEVINQIEPAKILDIGMFLKRIGAVSRQAMSESVDGSVLLDGIDVMPEIKVDVYNHIYNHQKTMDAFTEDVESAKVPFEEVRYELVVFLNVENYVSEEQEEKIWKWLAQHSNYVITDCKEEEKLSRMKQKGRFRDIMIEEDRYGLIIFG